MLKLMYITNQSDVAKIADENGVDRIFIDLEKIGEKRTARWNGHRAVSTLYRRYF